ncbi:PREDICTED: non-specific lipid-transfer protein-like protein At2g13820 [Ipomoea nil]|uniref:non-specific lipid-transfer protein-like protein At2g13820 n=1 Tax=Ipomoea nil TaxID=35883 RepID=UPI0009011E02|nr:PREDICTED: non-specific lipid-transfer protein-like protein At2g13820 [Ipomoea nil]
MAIQRGGVSLILLVALFWAGAAAQSSDDCTNVIISMSPCLNYITGNSSLPTAGCCTQLGTVVKNKPECLCQVLNGGASNLGLNINQTQALALPTACKIQTPSATTCKTTSPSGGSPTGTSGSPNTGSGGGSNSTPSGATSNKLAAPLVFFIPLVASYVSTFISC